jgi:hypothetical protein
MRTAPSSPSTSSGRSPLRRFVRTVAPLGLTLLAGGGVGLLLRSQRSPEAQGALSARNRTTAVTTKVAAPLCGRPLSTVPSEVQTEPTATDYDPARIMRLGVEGAELFKHEPRNERWASGMEAKIGSRLTSDLAVLTPAAKEVRMECRSRTCLVTWASLDREGNRRVREALDLGSLAPSEKILEAKDGRSGMFLFFPPADHLKQDFGEHFADFDASDPDRFAATYEARRKELYSGYRSGARKLPALLATASLPD